MSQLESRLNHELASYSEGDVFAHSSAFQAKFSHVFKCPNTTYAHRYLSSLLMKYCKNSSVLEVGCLENPQHAMIEPASPARYVGIDLCPEAIANAKKKFPKQEFYVMDAHNLQFDTQFDVIYGLSILHHLDFDLALTTFKKYLKPGGVLIFDEPLLDNPAGKLLRKMTPKCRTRDERPISRAQILKGNSLFSKEHHLFYNLFSVPVAMMTSFLTSNPNNRLLKATHLIDKKLAQSRLKWWMRRAILCWQN